MNKLVITRPPSLDTALKWIGIYSRHQHFNERMTGEQAHRAAATFLAVRCAMGLDILGKSWRKHRHVAAKCGELFDRIISEDVYRQSNVVFDVDIELRHPSGGDRHGE
ncbi:MAG: hypothetical protein NBV76_05440 [Candidatus Ochrobactrum gambitense]|nr:MAG: hypothetical protein NBV76_05440 [Candidatus Ochrobactrum gambitense]WEK17184.1 MAG: hypothetical protein P0Y54_05520 [Candidatus Ochrobactrum gambitense]